MTARERAQAMWWSVDCVPEAEMLPPALVIRKLIDEQNAEALAQWLRERPRVRGEMAKGWGK